MQKSVNFRWLKLLKIKLLSILLHFGLEFALLLALTCSPSIRADEQLLSLCFLRVSYSGFPIGSDKNWLSYNAFVHTLSLWSSRRIINDAYYIWGSTWSRFFYAYLCFPSSASSMTTLDLTGLTWSRFFYAYLRGLAMQWSRFSYTCLRGSFRLIINNCSTLRVACGGPDFSARVFVP